MPKKIDTSILHDDSDVFFVENGSATMRLSPAAAIAVCNEALTRGKAVTIIEGGLWIPPFFEARLDCIWWGSNPPLDIEATVRNNEKARTFIEEEAAQHSAFVITVAPYDRPLRGLP